ncbi:flavin reductase family protein [Celeribacter neptunius]|uniref:NADH-FMN oxidoreductase RutF, flavin reductase (DIM6/NTAB) family n=1 Tax=Celeribacter neptunius TaxID=588602 RepID=A0A1I3Y2M3_9RHOB|nr:flavin reductase family protein [Celeribacter neptunius]SFK26094.1 NADH-FMN oxidoreductase RutF, flavin reductase (DIM6/NTAB) family [Celeribacter neptunius]
MTHAAAHREFTPSDMAEGDVYKLLSGAVLPRPIAVVTSRSPEGIANAAPFSFFGILSHAPATVAIGIEPRPDGTRKDTARNIIETGEFTLHIPDVAMAQAVQDIAAPEAPEVDEIDLCGLARVPGTHVDCPRLLAAPVALECRFDQRLDLGPARDIVIGTVEGIFIREGAVNAALHVDPERIDALGRLGGATFATTRDRFQL